MNTKRNAEIVVISDCHLGTSSCDADSLLAYLKSINPKILILNGDIIDGWNFKKNNFRSTQFEVLRRLLKIINKGTKVYYLIGNHDDFMRKYEGIKFHNLTVLDQLVMEVGAQKIWFFHGDLFDTSIQGKMKILAKLGGKAYDGLILINRFVNNILMLLGRDKMSFAGRVKQSIKVAVKWVNDFENLAVNLAIKEGYDVVCCGHIHKPQIKDIKKDNNIITYLNSGDWIENNTALEYYNGQWSLYQHGIDGTNQTDEDHLDEMENAFQDLEMFNVQISNHYYIK